MLKSAIHLCAHHRNSRTLICRIGDSEGKRALAKEPYMDKDSDGYIPPFSYADNSVPGESPGYADKGGKGRRKGNGKSPGDHRPLSDDISPEMWSTMSRKQKERAVEAWEAKRVATLREQGESPCLPFLLSPCALAKPFNHVPDPPQPNSQRWVYDLLEQLA